MKSIFSKYQKTKSNTSRVITLFPISNWGTPEFMCKMWNKMSNTSEYCTWKSNSGPSIKLIHPTKETPIINPDYVLIANWINEITSIDMLIKYGIDPNKTIILPMEPYMKDQVTAPEMWREPKDSKDIMLDSHDKSKLFFKVLDHERYRNTLEWHISSTYHQLMDEKYNTSYLTKTKGNGISAILSNKNFDSGHKLRIDFMRALLASESNLEIDIYGTIKPELHNFVATGGRDSTAIKTNKVSYKGELPYQTKDKGLFGYKYHFNGENTMEKNYTTEKLVDAILSETLCFYWGTSDIDEIFDSRCYIKLPYDSENGFKKDIEIVKKAIENNEWEARIEIIRKVKKDILMKYQMFPMLSRLLS